MAYEGALDRRGQPGSLGAEIRKISQEMQEEIVHLQNMLDYARQNGKNEIANHLTNILSSFNDLKRRYYSAEVMDEIDAKTIGPIRADHRIEKTKAALRAATSDINTNINTKVEFRDIHSLLQSTRDLTGEYQTVYENFVDFSSPRNRFVELIEKIDKFETANKYKYAKNASPTYAKNSPTFFPNQAAIKKPVPKIIFESSKPKRK